MAFERSNSDRTAAQITIEIPDTPTRVAGTGPINLQFLPIITSDGKEGDWHEEDLASYEYLSVFKGSKARSMNVQLKWLATGEPGFTASEIQRYCQAIKSYFYTGIADSGAVAPVVNITGNANFPLFGASTMTFKMKSCSITPSDTYVNEGGVLYPLVMKASFKAELYTQVEFDGKPKQPVENLVNKPSFEWY